MKKLLFLIIFLSSFLYANAQTGSSEPLRKYEYCEVAMVKKPFSSKLYATINIGNSAEKWEAIKNRNDKNIEFKNKISILNYFGQLGWKYLKYEKTQTGIVYLMIREF